MKQVSVLIPTCKRPGLLRNALRSVQDQTALSRILEVVIVENGGQRESESVCREFPALPIRYIFRDPPLPPEHAGRDFFTKARGELVAVLFDDDWWDRRHLESGLQALERHPTASAYHCPAFWLLSESGYPNELRGSFIPWFSCSTAAADGLLLLSLKDMVVASILGTGFQYPCLIARNEHLGKSLGVYDYGNPYDTDRMLGLELAKHGVVIYDSIPAVFMRGHPGQERQRVEKDGTAKRWADDSVRRILAFAGENGINLGEEFSRRILTKGVKMRLLIPSWLGCIESLARDGLLGRDMQRRVAVQKRWNLVRRWVPLAMLEIGQSVCRKLFNFEY